MVVAMTDDIANLEQAFTKACETVGSSCREKYRACEDKIHKNPGGAVLVAAGIGYLASVLPVCRIGGALLRFTFALAKPALIVFGALKLLECLEKKNNRTQQVEELEREREPLVDSPTGPPQA